MRHAKQARSATLPSVLVSLLYFVDVPRRLAPDGNLLITLRHQGNAPVAIGRVWTYGDFVRLAAADLRPDHWLNAEVRHRHPAIGGPKLGWP